jgi:hypothetical protein
MGAWINATPGLTVGQRCKSNTKPASSLFCPYFDLGKEKDSRVITVSPLVSKCPRQESNLHGIATTRPSTCFCTFALECKSIDFTLLPHGTSHLTTRLPHNRNSNQIGFELPILPPICPQFFDIDSVRMRQKTKRLSSNKRFPRLASFRHSLAWIAISQNSWPKVCLTTFILITSVVPSAILSPLRSRRRSPKSTRPE